MNSNLFRTNFGEYSAEGVDLRTLTSSIYGISEARIVTDLSFSDDRYDVSLKMPQGQEYLLEATLQKALEAHFGITAQREIRETDVYILTAPEGRSPNLREPVSKKDSRSYGLGKMSFHNMQIGGLCSKLEAILKRPVLDETNLKGKYDFEFNCVHKNSESLASAVREQLGLELTPARRPIEILIIKKQDSGTVAAIISTVAFADVLERITSAYPYKYKIDHYREGILRHSTHVFVRRSGATLAGESNSAMLTSQCAGGQVHMERTTVLSTVI
jgi:uncharacterized protein (TIGR03435 family)